jgi:hypothetical protein
MRLFLQLIQAKSGCFRCICCESKDDLLQMQIFARYCSNDCQRADWKDARDHSPHKIICQVSCAETVKLRRMGGQFKYTGQNTLENQNFVSAKVFSPACE